MHRMTRFVSLLTALALLFLNGTAASRVCACLEELGKPSCCQQKMPCCDDGECKAHPEASIKAELALDLLKSLDSVSALPLIAMPAVSALAITAPTSHAPLSVRVRGPDIRSHSLRAPPIQA
jgi:hypothetical protein